MAFYFFVRLPIAKAENKRRRIVEVATNSIYRKQLFLTLKFKKNDKRKFGFTKHGSYSTNVW